MKNFKLTQLDMFLAVSAGVIARQSFCVGENLFVSAK